MHDNLKITLTKVISTTDCTTDFFEEESFPEGYAIIHISETTYGIANLKESKCEIVFKEITRVQCESFCYLLKFENNNMALLKFEMGQMFLSEPFQEVLKEFTRYLLVSDLAGERKLVPLIYFHNVSFQTWPNCAENGAEEDYNHAIMDLPNGKKTILLRDGLFVSDIEFVSAEKNPSSDNIFRIVDLGDGNGKVLIRICDLEKLSERIKVFFSHKRSLGESYAILKLENDKQCILRISDFQKSREHKEISFFSFGYACVSDDGECDNVVRLSDFLEAKWE